MTFPLKYNWLNTVGTLPKMISEALKEYGTIETPGPANNKKIISWANELGVKNAYTADAVPWCGLFIGLIAKRAGKTPVDHPLWALNWAKFGSAAGQPCLGDVLVFARDGGGHVGLYIAEDNECYHVLGGNQSDSVCITRIFKKRLFAARRPRYWFSKPKSVVPYLVSANGTQTTINEQ